MNLDGTEIFNFEGLWKLAKYPPETDGYYMTIRCGLSGIYTNLDEWKSGQWQVGILDDSQVIAYQKEPVSKEEVDAWCREKLRKYRESLGE